MVSVAAGSFGFVLVAGVVLAIIVPPWYRSLQPRYQEIWVIALQHCVNLKRKPPKKRMALEYEGNTDNALALLDTPTPTLTPTHNRILRWPPMNRLLRPFRPNPLEVVELILTTCLARLFLSTGHCCTKSNTHRNPHSNSIGGLLRLRQKIN